LLVLSAFSGLASEPEGRIAFRYQWLKDPERLRLSITTLVPITDARLEAKSPSGAATFLKSWSPAGLALDGLAVGVPTILELEVVPPKEGGEIISFSVRGIADGETVQESVGVPVGTPGVAPVLRNGAAEFPAVRDGTRP
jgi:hypothetical protein